MYINCLLNYLIERYKGELSITNRGTCMCIHRYYVLYWLVDEYWSGVRFNTTSGVYQRILSWTEDIRPRNGWWKLEDQKTTYQKA